MIEQVVRFLDGFFKRHATVKSAVRALGIAIVTAVLLELGLDDVVQAFTGS